MVNVTLLFLIASIGSTWAFPAEFWDKKLNKVDFLRNMILEIQKLHEEKYKKHQEVFKMPAPKPNNDKPLLPPPTVVNPVPELDVPWEIQPQPWTFPSAPAPVPVLISDPYVDALLPVWPEAEKLSFVSLDSDLFKKIKSQKDIGLHQLPPLPVLSIQKNLTKTLVFLHVPVPYSTTVTAPTSITPIPTTVATPVTPVTSRTTTPAPCVPATTTVVPPTPTGPLCPPNTEEDKSIDIQVQVIKHVL